MPVYEAERALVNKMSNKIEKLYNELMPILNACVEESLRCHASPALTKLLYKAVQIVKEYHPDKIIPLKPGGPPTISRAAPSPQGPGGEIEDPLLEDPAPPTITYAAPSSQGPNGEIEDPLAELEESPTSK